MSTQFAAVSCVQNKSCPFHFAHQPITGHEIISVLSEQRLQKFGWKKKYDQIDNNLFSEHGDFCNVRQIHMMHVWEPVENLMIQELTPD